MEMSIILAVVGLVIGAIVIPSFSLLTDDTYREEERRMEQIKTALFGYAVRHRTTGEHSVEVHNGGANARVFELPAGRPYLPCPDINGDGYEDRGDSNSAGIVSDSSPQRIRIDTAIAAQNGFLADFRRCGSSRGVLPWRTLGLPAADHWGNLYTYYVDNIYSDSMVGFNENTAIDVFDQRTPVRERTPGADLTYSRRTASGVFIEHSNRNAESVNVPLPPLLVCNGDNCGAGADPAALDLVGGRFAGAGFGGAFRFRDFNENDVIAGIPFAVVSHGKNGNGAVSYGIASSRAGRFLTCNWPVRGRAGGAAVSYDQLEGFNFPQPEGSFANTECQPVAINGVDATNGFIVDSRRVKGGFDDVVMWVTQEELVAAMNEAGVLPAPALPVLRTY